MTRVLVVTNMYPPHHLGGYELSCFDVVERLRRRGHDVSVLTSDMRVEGVDDPPDEPTTGVWRDLQLYLHDGELVSPSLRGRLTMERSNQRALRRAIDAVRPDVVSVWHMGALSMGLLTTLVNRDVPLVYSICDDWLSYGARLDAWTRALRPFGRPGRLAGRLFGAPVGVNDLSSTGAFLFVSRLTRDRSVRYTGWTFPVSDVVLSGIDSTLFHGVEEPRAREWRWRLLFVGRYDPRKGLDTLLEALPLLPAAATLRVVGTGVGPDRDRLVHRVAELGLEERVTFEQRDRRELPAVYAAADAFVFPSAWEEPFGLVPLEAMALRTPVVATGVGGGGAEFMRDGANCLLFPAGDAPCLAKTLETLAADEPLRRTLVEGGVQTAAQLDVDHLADTFEAWHAAAADRFAGGRPPGRRLQLPRAAQLTTRRTPDRSVRGYALPPMTTSAAALLIDGETVVVITGDTRHEVVCDFAALPFCGAAFAEARCVDALERLPDPSKGVDELGRTLRPGSRCTFAAVNRYDARRLLLRRRDHRPRRERWPCDDYPSTRHLHCFSGGELERLLEPHFAPGARSARGWGTGWRGRAATALLRLPGARRLGAAVVIDGTRR